MPGAIIVIDQLTGAGPGTPGISRNDLWNGQPVTLHVGTTGNSSYQWDLLWAPVGSAAEIDSPLTETCHFTPDMVGTYRFRLITNGGGADNVSILIARVRFDSTGVLENRGWAYPAFGEKDGENNYSSSANSWAEIIEYIFEDVRLNGFGGGGNITLGGDLAAWEPAAADHQRVAGLNTVALPVAMPTNADLLQARSSVLLSAFPFDSTSDGTQLWVGDTESPAASTYGGLVSVLFADEFISTRYAYDSATTGVPANIRIWSVCYLNGYVYATVTSDSLVPGPTAVMLLRINPATGWLDGSTAADMSGIPGMAYVRTDGTYLYLLVPNAAKDDPAFYWVNPVDLTVQTPFDPNPNGYGAGLVGFAYDPDTGNGKVWLGANLDSSILRVDAVTHAIDFVVVAVTNPSAMVYVGALADEHIWVLDYEAVYGQYAHGHYAPPGPTTLKLLDPSDGSVIATVTDVDNLISGALRMAYDATNGKVWVVCDDTKIGEPYNAGPRLVRVDVVTRTVDGWCSLDSTNNMAITVAGGYVWVVDSPGGDPAVSAPMTILKIDPLAVVYPEPFATDPTTTLGVIARITNGPVSYQFVKKNVASVSVASADYAVGADEEVVFITPGNTVTLPFNPVDGERHTVVDYQGGAAYANINVSYWNGYGYSVLGSITTDSGSLTAIYSAVAGAWAMI